MTRLTSAASSPRLLNGVVRARTDHTLGNNEDWGGQAYDTQRSGTRKPGVPTTIQAEAERGPLAQDAMALPERYKVQH